MTDGELTDVATSKQAITGSSSGAPWFARRFPKGDPRNAMGPVSWQGWAAFALFTLALIAGGMALLLLAIWGSLWMGLLAFALFAWGAMMTLLKLVALKGDQTKTMEDYIKAERDAAN